MYNSNHHSPHGRVIFHCSFAWFNLKTDITEMQCPINLCSFLSLIFIFHWTAEACCCIRLQHPKVSIKILWKARCVFLLAALAIYWWWCWGGGGREHNKWLVDRSFHSVSKFPRFFLSKTSIDLAFDFIGVSIPSILPSELEVPSSFCSILVIMFVSLVPVFLPRFSIS